MAAATSAAGRPSRCTTFHLSDSPYGLNQLRYDLRKLKGHGLLQRWRMSGHPAVQQALRNHYFHSLGLPRLFAQA
jgi:hypothetical protein